MPSRGPVADGHARARAAQLHPGHTWSLLFDQTADIRRSTCLALYLVFLFVRTVRQQDYFVPVGVGEAEHEAAPLTRIGAISSGLRTVAKTSSVLSMGHSRPATVESDWFATARLADDESFLKGPRPEVMRQGLTRFLRS